MKLILDDLLNKDRWIEFYEYKSKNYIRKTYAKELYSYIEQEKYKSISKQIVNGTYVFGFPKKSEISKAKTGKKRVIYSYDYDEVMILKMINYMLYEYDYLFCDNCYSFRKNNSVYTALKSFIEYDDINNLYGYKLDISNYFNSVDVNIILTILKEEIKEEHLYELLEQILINDKVIFHGKVIKDNKKGIMAGVPISAFLANLYLKEMDSYFYNKDVLYARYSDDIILFADSYEKLKKYVKVIDVFLEKYKLTKNSDKEYYIMPNTKWEFLGFSYSQGKIDLSDNTKNKIKAKIRRSARAIRRWKIRKNVDDTVALRIMINNFNKKFFFEREDREFNWSRWFFPVINVTEGLNEVDIYLQENLRYMITGKHNKKNFEKVPYRTLKDFGYRSLVHEYYETKKRQKLEK